MQSRTKAPIPSDLAAILEAMEEGVVVGDGGGELLFVNEAGAKLLGLEGELTPEGLHRQAVLPPRAPLELLAEDGQPLAPQALPSARALTGEHPPPTEMRARRPGGDERWTVLSATPLFDEGAQVRQVVSVFRDVTTQRRSEQALRLLAEAGRALAQSLDYVETVGALARLVVPTLADGCFVEIFEEDGSTRLVSMHAEPAKDALAREMRGRYPLRPEAAVGVGKAVGSGRPQLLRRVTDADLQRVAVNEEHAAMLRALEFRGVIAVPLVTRGRTLGVLTLLGGEGRRPFDDEDLALAVELAGRASLAVDNARLYAQTQRSLTRKDEEARTSETLRRIGSSIASELEPARLVQRIIDEAISACGAAMGVFQYSRPEEEGETSFVATGAGTRPDWARVLPVPRAGEAFPVPLQEPLRVDDLGADPRFAGWKSNPPPGVAPIRSYLAAQVRSREDQVMAGLFLGHPEPRRFGPTHLRLLTDIAAQAAIALENARLFHQLRLTEAKSRASEERLRLALDAGRMGHFDLDLRAQRLFMSRRMKEMAGVPENSLPGDFDSFLARVHPEDRAALQQRTLRMSQEGVKEDFFAYRLLRADGPRWIESHTKLVVDGEGKPVRLLGVALDVTERTQAEQQAVRLAGEQAARAEAEAGQRRIEAILDSISEPLFALDGDGHVRFLNLRAEELAGRKRMELTGRPAREVPPFSVVPELLARCRQAREADAPVELEVQLPNGPWYEVRASPFHEGISVYLRDITARRREQEVQARLARYEALRADVSTALSGQGTLPATLQRCCEAMVRHLGVAFARVWGVDARSQSLELQAAAGGPVEPEDPYLRIPIGQHRVGQIALHKRPFLTNDAPHDALIGERTWAAREELKGFAGYPLLVGDQLIGVMAMFSARPLPEDMVPALSPIADALAQGIERRRAEQELAAHADELARSNAELEQFAYVASHDLQEPLRMVASYTQLLARRYKGKLDADADQFIAFAVEGVTRMKRLISDLLTYSRAGHRNQEPGPASLERALDRALVDLRAQIEKSGATVNAEPLPTVLGDEAQLEQLLKNLIGNAIKFRGAAPPEIHITAERQDGEWLVRVRDNGIGIDPQYAQRIFIIFQRLHAKEEYPGTGIGLAICKKIVERHGGRIWVDSTPGQGATFLFTLPNLNPDPSRSMRSL